MNKLKTGLNDCSNAVYHADREYLSSSVLKKVYDNLEQYHREYILGIKEEQKESPALAEGSLVHAMLLEPDTIDKEFVFYSGLRKSGDNYEQWKASLSATSSKKIIISEPQRLRCLDYVKAHNSRLEAVQMLSGGAPELTLCGTLHGVPIKVRFDYINVDKGYIYDVKTTGKPANIEIFKESVKGLKYQLSAALYCAMAEQFYGKKFDFYFGVISKQDMMCDVYKTSAATMLEGTRMVEQACAKYLKAKSTNIWTEEPKYDIIEAPKGYIVQEV